MIASAFRYLIMAILAGSLASAARAQPGAANARKPLQVGATVIGTDGVPIGTILTADITWVTVQLTSGRQIKVGRPSFTAGPKGVAIDMTSRQVAAMTGGSRTP